MLWYHMRSFHSEQLRVGTWQVIQIDSLVVLAGTQETTEKYVTGVYPNGGKRGLRPVAIVHLGYLQFTIIIQENAFDVIYASVKSATIAVHTGNWSL